MNSSSNVSSSFSVDVLWIMCPSSPYGILIFFIVEAVNFVIGVPVNAWTIWSITCSPPGIQAPEVFTLNLAVLECVYSLFSFLRPLNYYLIRSIILQYFNRVFYGLLCAGRPVFQACICVERYVGVVHPVTYLRYNSVRTRLRALPLVLALVLVFGVCLVCELYLPFPVLFTLLLLLQGFCCVRILQVLRQSGPGEGSREQADPVKKKAFITVLVIQVMLVLNYLPTVLATLLEDQLSRRDYFCQLIPAALSFSAFGSYVQPFMYLMRRARSPSEAKA